MSVLSSAWRELVSSMPRISKFYVRRWVEGDTPTSKDVESDRAASIEIQQVLGIDHVTYTPPQLQR